MVNECLQGAPEVMGNLVCGVDAEINKVDGVGRGKFVVVLLRPPLAGMVFAEDQG
jgi:hypothetical protein